jgi:hypothetical protein
VSDREDQLEHLRIDAEALQNLGEMLYESVLELKYGTDPDSPEGKQPGDPLKVRKLISDIGWAAISAEGHLSEWEGL